MGGSRPNERGEPASHDSEGWRREVMRLHELVTQCRDPNRIVGPKWGAVDLMLRANG